jgi:plasmid stabilization system protein ParE
LIQRRVRFTETAKQHLEREQAWWRENRDRAELFVTELESALAVLSTLPGAGALYTVSGTPNLRRVYLRKLGCHLYYTFDDLDVIVRALWGARRERGPTC